MAKVQLIPKMNKLYVLFSLRFKIFQLIGDDEKRSFSFLKGVFLYDLKNHRKNGQFKNLKTKFIFYQYLILLQHKFRST